MKYNINHADIKEWAKNYDGPLFDGILCDPPYELGFMGKSWDSSGIAFDKDMWADILRILKPGGHLLAFSGSRTYHRMAVAIEDAGFEIRDMIEWVYGSGFPKSLNIGKAVDKLQGNEREVIGDNPNHRPNSPKDNTKGDFNPNSEGNKILTKGNSPYEGYGTALKPAHEPCVLARKPLEKGMTVATNALKHGTGGLNIDGTRVGYTDEKDKNSAKPGSFNYSDDSTAGYVALSTRQKLKDNWQQPTGRFPANFIHDGSDEVEAVFPDTKGGKFTQKTRKRDKGWGNSSPGDGVEAIDNYGDSGSASRFFYTAKASKSERNAGLEGFEEKEREMMAQMGQGNTPQQTPHQNTPQANHHPTVKPLSLTKYLATLIKPPTGGRLLVPFSGSGSEMIGALQAGWEYVEGVELTEEYIPIAEARIKYWLDKIDNEPLTLL